MCIRDRPYAETQPDGGRVQHRQREFHAGNTVDGKRVFRQPAHEVRVSCLLYTSILKGIFTVRKTDFTKRYTIKKGTPISHRHAPENMTTKRNN